MLTKRTNILFEEETWNTLRELSKRRSLSIGNLIRNAVQHTYSKDLEIEQRKRAIELIERHRVFQKNIDYKELINAGRKY